MKDISKKGQKRLQILTLQDYLEQKFGKEQVKVVEWKWTDKQLEQLKKSRR